MSYLQDNAPDIGGLKLSTSAGSVLTISVISRWNWMKLAGFMQNCLLNPKNVTACRFVELEARYGPNSRTSARVCKKSDLHRTFIKFLKFESGPRTFSNKVCDANF